MQLEQGGACLEDCIGKKVTNKQTNERTVTFLIEIKCNFYTVFNI